MIEAFLLNSGPSEKILYLAMICTTAVVLMWIVFFGLVRLFHGFPIALADKQDCHDDKNLTGKCLKYEPCKTEAQCEQQLRFYSPTKEVE